MLVEAHHTPASARAALPDAVRELREDRGEKNTVHTLTLAVIACSTSHKDLLREIDALATAARKEVEAEARSRLKLGTPETADSAPPTSAISPRAGPAPADRAISHPMPPSRASRLSFTFSVNKSGRG